MDMCKHAYQSFSAFKRIDLFKRRFLAQLWAVMQNLYYTWFVLPREDASEKSLLWIAKT